MKLHTITLAACLALAPLCLSQAQEAPAEPTPAVATTTPPKTPLAAPKPPSEDEYEPTITELAGEGKKVAENWTRLGWVVGLAGLINLLMNLLKIGAIKKVFERKEIKWVKPYISAGLGAGAAGFGMYAESASVVEAIVAGAVAGLGAVGLNETLKRRRKEQRKA